MDQTVGVEMKWLKRTFIDNWPRKLFSLILAIIIYFTMSQGMTVTRVVSDIPVRVTNLPKGMTVEGMDTSGVLKKRVNLTLTGNKNLIEEITPGDLEVVLDATGKPREWVAQTSRDNLHAVSGDIKLSRALKRVSAKNIVVRAVKLVSEKVPVVITQPIGHAPKGYNILDVWPYHIETTVSGPEAVVKKLKHQGLKLTFNLNDITRGDLDTLSPLMNKGDNDVISYKVPDAWKRIYVPSLAKEPIVIDDPMAKNLRIDFLRYEMMPLHVPIPVSLYFPLKSRFSPHKIALGHSDALTTLHGIRAIPAPLFVRGVSALFLEVVKNHLEVSIVVNPTGDNEELAWSIQFINPKVLEDRYVSCVLQDVSSEDLQKMNANTREEYIRNRFRNYMNRMTLFKQDFEPLAIRPILDGNRVIVKEGPGA